MAKIPAVFAIVLALSACSTHRSPGTAERPPASAGQPSAGQATKPRIDDQEIGVSYIVSKEYHSGKAQASEITLVLNGSTDVKINLWRLAKDAPENAQFATMDANQSVDYIVNMIPKGKRGVVLQRTSWSSADFPAAAIAVITPLDEPGDDPSATPPGGPKRSLTYYAFLGKEDQKWMVQASVRTSRTA